MAASFQNVCKSHHGAVGTIPTFVCGLKGHNVIAQGKVRRATSLTVALGRLGSCIEALKGRNKQLVILAALLACDFATRELNIARQFL
jgi:hypothetical protein